MNKIIEKLKDVLEESDLKTLEEAIDSLITEKVALKEDELKVKYEKLSEEYVQKQVLAESEKVKKQLEEEYQKKSDDLESTIVEKLDAFLDNEICESISDEMLEKIAINETLSPVVDGIKKVFSENSLELDSEGSKLLSQLKEEVETQKTEISELIEEKIDLSTKLEKAVTKILIESKIAGLTESQKTRVNEMFNGKSFDEVEEKIDSFVDLVLESKEDEDSEEVINENIDPTSNEDGMKKETPKIKDDFSDMANLWL